MYKTTILIITFTFVENDTIKLTLPCKILLDLDVKDLWRFYKLTYYKYL